MWKVIVLLALLTFSPCDGLFRSLYQRTRVSQPPSGDTGQPLFLTPYIESGKIMEGRKLSLVKAFLGLNIISYSGYLTVNKTYNSNIFFWFFPAQVQPETAPVVLWLQGGPGGSSMFGLFVEHGPYVITNNMTVQSRNFPWTTTLSMLYMDNPVGTGFSFTNHSKGYAVDEEDVAHNLYNALVQFFQLFPEYEHNDFYATGEVTGVLTIQLRILQRGIWGSGSSAGQGAQNDPQDIIADIDNTPTSFSQGESYAGKYVPAIAYYIHSLNSTKKVKIHLKGIALGNAYSDPESIIRGYAAFLYEIGLLDERQKKYFQKQCNKCVKYIKEQSWLRAFKILDRLLDGDLTSDKSYFQKVTGCSNYYNILQCTEPGDQSYYGKFLSLSEVRRAIHVGNQTFSDGTDVEKHLRKDTMKSVKPWLIDIMNNYKVLLYNGQLDIIVAASLTERSLMSMDWKGSYRYKKASRKVWKIFKYDDEVAGYVRQVDNFHQVIVRGGGHILPLDQPLRSFDMINRFIFGRGWDPYD